MPKPNPSTSLAEARSWLSDRLDEGEQCPCCEQLAKIYPRSIHSKMARDLIKAYRLHGLEPFKPIETLGASSPDFVKLRYWGLLEEVEPDAERDDGSKRTGVWRITVEGKRFALNVLTVPKTARIYDGRLLSLKGDEVGIRDALGSKFNYTELMTA